MPQTTNERQMSRLMTKLAALERKLDTITGILNVDMRTPDRIISMDEACQLLNVCRKTMERRIAAGVIPVRKSGRKYEFSFNQIQSMIQRGL